MTKADKIRRMFKQGMSSMDIVRKLKCSPGQVYRLKPKPKLKLKLKRVLKSVLPPAPSAVRPAVNDTQVGGEHYKKYGNIQPWDTWLLWGLNPFQAAILKYVVRYRDKDGVKDLEKAAHFLDKLIELETGNRYWQTVKT